MRGGPGGISCAALKQSAVLTYDWRAGIRVWPWHVDQLKVTAIGPQEVLEIESDHMEKQRPPRGGLRISNIDSLAAA